MNRDIALARGTCPDDWHNPVYHQPSAVEVGRRGLYTAPQRGCRGPRCPASGTSELFGRLAPVQVRLLLFPWDPLFSSLTPGRERPHGMPAAMQELGQSLLNRAHPRSAPAARPRRGGLHLHRRSGPHHVRVGHGSETRRRFGARPSRMRRFVILYWGAAAETAIYEIARNAFLMRDFRAKVLKYLFCTGGDCCPASC